MVPIHFYIILAFILFLIGVYGFLFRRAALIVFMSIEIMLNSINLAFVAFSKMWHNVDGQVFVFFIITLAAAEISVGLAIIISLFRKKSTVNVDEFNLLKH